MGNKDKNKEQDRESASAKSIISPQNAWHTNRDLSWEREAWDTALAKTTAEAEAREMAKAHSTLPSLKVTSGALGFKVMDPFYWSKDKVIFQRWQLWSEKARDALDAMKVTQKSLRFHTFTIALMERE